MHVTEFADAHSFLQSACLQLQTNEVENDLLLGCALSFSRGNSRPRSVRPGFFTVTRQTKNSEVVCSALNVSGRRFLLSTSRPEPAHFLGRALSDRTVKISSIVGPSESTEAFCEGFGRSISARQVLNLRVLTHTRSLKANSAPGLCRTAQEKDLPILIEWSRQLANDSLVTESDNENEDLLRSYLSQKQLLLWENDRIAAMAGFREQTPGGARINMVFTDSELRSRGYAKSLVSSISHKLLNSGKRKYCYLFVSSKNQPANHVYETLGYQETGKFTECLIN